MQHTLVQYTLKAGQVAENELLIRAVYRELQELRPPGFHYVTCKLADGVSFMHLALVDPHCLNPLPTLEAFKAFQQGIRSRCEALPVVTHPAVIGAYYGSETWPLPVTQ